MDQLLDATARAEREHFWFRGFRRFVAPLLARAVAGRHRARASSIAAAAPATTCVCCGDYGRAMRHRSHAQRPRLRAAAGRAAGRPGIRAVTSFLGRRLRSRHLVRRDLCVRRRHGGNGLEGDVPGAAAWRGAGAQRGGAAGPSRQPLDSRRRSAALHPLGPAPSSRAGGIRRCSASPIRISRFFRSSRPCVSRSGCGRGTTSCRTAR